MRKMFSQEQIKKIAQEAGGGLPEIQSGDAGKALVVNSEETGAEWATVSGGSDTLVLDFENQSTKTVTQEEANNISNFVYDKIILQNFKQKGLSLVFVDSSKTINAKLPAGDFYNIYFNSRAYIFEEKMQIISDSDTDNTYGEIANTALRANVGFYKANGGSLSLSGTTLSIITNTYVPCIHIDTRYRQKATAASLSGTLTAGVNISDNVQKSSKALLDAVVIWQPTSGVNKYILFKVVNTVSTGSGNTSYAILKAEDVDYDNGTVTTYLMKWFTKTGTYEIKAI